LAFEKGVLTFENRVVAFEKEFWHLKNEMKDYKKIFISIMEENSLDLTKLKVTYDVPLHPSLVMDCSDNVLQFDHL
jgi:hypothetical protein